MKPIIYEYGARLDKDCLSAVNEQFYLARTLYNKIIEIVTNARNEADKFLRENDSDVAAKMAEIEALNQQFDVAKSINDEEAMGEIAKKRRSAWRELTPLMKKARRQFKDELAAFFAPIGLKKECATYQARCEFVAQGLGSTTADDIHAAALKAWDKVRKDGGKLSFRSGRLRQQDHIINRFAVAGGVANEELLSGRHASIGLTPPAEMGDRRYGEFKFRLGPAKKESYATGTWQYHRPLPKGSRVSTVRLVRKRIGSEYRWALQLQLSVPDYPKIAVRNDRKPLAALHLGFNLADSGARRIGAIIDSSDSGFAEFIDLPERIPMELYRVTQIQSRLDEMRDNIHAAIIAMPANVQWPDEQREEWDKIRKLPAQQVSVERIKRLSRSLEQQQITDETAIMLKQYTLEDHWKREEMRHLHAKTLAFRKNHYRALALDLVKRYQHIVIGRLDLKNMALRIDKNGERNELGQIARHARHNAALYQLIECIKWAAARSDAIVIEDTELGYAARCSDCGEAFERDSDYLECPHCGHEADIKANASANLYTRWLDKHAQKADEIRLAKADQDKAAADKKAAKLERMQAKRKISIEKTKLAATTPARL